MANSPSDELVIDETNFAEHFHDVRQSKPKKGQVVARFTAVAELVDGGMKRDIMNLLKNTTKAIPASNVMRKLGCATEVESLKVCRAMVTDYLAGLGDEEVAAKPYEYQLETFYYTDLGNVPEDNPRWSVISLLNLDEFVDRAGRKLDSSWKILDGDDVSAAAVPEKATHGNT